MADDNFMKNFCVVPWHGRDIDLQNDGDNICCWIQSKITRQELQTKFLSGQRPSDCDRCWQSESKNIESRRQMENRFLDFKMDRDLEFLADDAVQGRSHINLYQMFLGSTCNGTCVTCGPGASSAWRALLKNPISIRQENSLIDRRFEAVADSIDWKNAKRFNLLGGEPLLINRSFDMLRRLLDAGNTDCRISFVTNGSVVPTPEQIDLIQNFSDISCCVSIDGVGKLFEYLRYPLTWPVLLDNIHTYRRIFSEVVVSFTVSNINYHARTDIIDWFKSTDLLYIENYVVNPQWFNHAVGPGHELWPKFVSEITRQDQLKGIDIKDYVPEVYDLIQQSKTVE
jgi:MoaA/NifB/PqqE/SkfB family radical SAM enzyme